MAAFVADASVTLCWCFEDEAQPWTEQLLDRVQHGDQMIVPAHWPAEITNALLIGVRRKRVPLDRPNLFWDTLSILPIEIELPLHSQQAKSVLKLCTTHNLTVYDAIYLEAALRRGLPLVSLDVDLRRASQAEGVRLP